MRSARDQRHLGTWNKKLKHGINHGRHIQNAVEYIRRRESRKTRVWWRISFRAIRALMKWVQEVILLYMNVFFNQAAEKHSQNNDQSSMPYTHFRKYKLDKRKHQPVHCYPTTAFVVVHDQNSYYWHVSRIEKNKLFFFYVFVCPVCTCACCLINNCYIDFWLCSQECHT